MTGPLVGIFWLVLTSGGIRLLSYAVPCAEAEIYGDCRTCPVGHYEAWEASRHDGGILAPSDAAMRLVIASSEYEVWPRGRVVFEMGADRFVVYADRQAFPYAPLITAKFNLPEATIFKTDSHYRLARRIGP
jgi:hypothetical protein